MRAGGGIKAINYSLKVAQKVGNKNFIEAITSKNTCKTCALGMGGQQGGMKNEAGHFPEICKKSMQANLTDIQPAIAKKVFSKNSIQDFKNMSGRQLEHLGRLNDPLYKSTGDTHYKPVSWDFVIGKIIEK